MWREWCLWYKTTLTHNILILINVSQNIIAKGIYLYMKYLMYEILILNCTDAEVLYSSTLCEIY